MGLVSNAESGSFGGRAGTEAEETNPALAATTAETNERRIVFTREISNPEDE
jgi:hypothetical protein